MGELAHPPHDADPGLWLAWSDEVADAFEAEWQTTAFPSIATYLGTTHGDRRRALLEELVQIDLEYREQAGKSRTLEDYAREFPELLGSMGISPRLVLRARQVKEWAGTDMTPHPARRDELPPSAQPESSALTTDLPRRVGHFQLVEVLGRGGFGTVYKARDEQLGRWVAIKMSRAGSFASSEEQRRFLHEARSAAELNHPGIVPVHSIAHEADVPYIVSEYIDGTTLADALDRRRLEFRETAELVAQIADALDYAHRRKIVHRDVNPRNVLLDADGRPHLTDFGLAQHQDASVVMTLDGELLGTPAYMAPEQAAGHARAVDGRSDVYSLGVIFYQMLTGELPFRGTAPMLLLQVVTEEPPAPRRLNDRVPQELETICLKAMAKLPSGRYATAGEFAADLRRYLAGEPILARRASRWERARKWVRRRPMQAAASLASLVAAGCLVLALWYAISLRTTRKIAAVEVQAARDVAAAQEYYALVNQVRESRARPRPGWTWTGLARLRCAAGLSTSARNPVELRSEAAACLAAFDLREAAVLGSRVVPFCLAFSPDGKRLAIGPLRGGSSTTVPVYDMDSRELEFELPLPPPSLNVQRTGVRSLAFSPDSRWLVAGTRSGAIHAWDLNRTSQPQPAEEGNRQAPAASWNAHTDDVLGLAFSPDGTWLVSSSADRTIRRWKPSEAWREVSSLRADHRVDELAYRSDGRLVAVGSPNGLSFVDAATFDFLPEKDKIAATHHNHQVRFSPDGRVLALSDQWGIVLFDTHVHKVVRELRDPELPHAHEDDIAHLDFSPDGSLLVSGAHDRKIKVWEVASGRILVAITMLGVGNVFPVFSPDGRFLAVTGNRQTILYEITGKREQVIMAEQPYPVRAIDFAPDGKTLACLAEEIDFVRRRPGGGEVSLWDLAQRRVSHREDVSLLTPRDPRSPVSVAYHPDGTRLAFSYGHSDQKSFRLWDSRSGERRAPGTDWKAVSLCFSRDGRTLWTAGNKGNQVASWRVPELTLASAWSNAGSTLGDGRTSVYCVSAGSQWVIAGSWDGSVKLFREEDGGLVSVWPCPGGPVLCVALSHDEGWFAAGSQNGSAYVVRVPGGELGAELKGHRDSVNAVSFHGAGNLLATGSRDGTVRLWQRTGESFGEVLSLPSPTGPVSALTFSPDGNQLAILVKNELAVRLWNLMGLRQRLEEMGLSW